LLRKETCPPTAKHRFAEVIWRIPNPTLTAQGWNNRTPISHERVDSRFLVLPGSESTITEITE